MINELDESFRETQIRFLDGVILGQTLLTSWPSSKFCYFIVLLDNTKVNCINVLICKAKDVNTT